MRRAEVLALVSFLLLLGCSGGGDDRGPTSPTAPPPPAVRHNTLELSGLVLPPPGTELRAGREVQIPIRYYAEQDTEIGGVFVAPNGDLVGFTGGRRLRAGDEGIDFVLHGDVGPDQLRREPRLRTRLVIYMGDFPWVENRRVYAELEVGEYTWTR